MSHKVCARQRIHPGPPRSSHGRAGQGRQGKAHSHKITPKNKIRCGSRRIQGYGILRGSPRTPRSPSPDCGLNWYCSSRTKEWLRGWWVRPEGRAVGRRACGREGQAGTVPAPWWWCTWPAAEMGARLVPSPGRRGTPIILQPGRLPPFSTAGRQEKEGEPHSRVLTCFFRVGIGAKTLPGMLAVELDCWLAIPPGRQEETSCWTRPIPLSFC